MVPQHLRKGLNTHPDINGYSNAPPGQDRIMGGLRLRGEFIEKNETGMPLVSILTPSFNNASSIEQTIQSVLNQTYYNIEYIIIDGGSTDGTIDMIRKYDDRIAYWISEPDKGIGDAFNKGIAASTGDIIGIINADDWYASDTVETVVREYRSHGDRIFHAKLQYWDAHMRPYYVFSGDDDKIMKRGTINHPTVFVPKKIYGEIGLFDTSFRNAMDYEWLLRAKLRGTRFHYIDRVTANMRLDGRSDKRWLDNYVEIFRARRLHGTGLITNSLLFAQMLSLTVCRKLLEFMGLRAFVSFYRKHLSITRKEAL